MRWGDRHCAGIGKFLERAIARRLEFAAPMHSTPAEDYYAVLGIPAGADGTELRRGRAGPVGRGGPPPPGGPPPAPAPPHPPARPPPPAPPAPARGAPPGGRAG